jgi:hypothetical protein
VLFSLYVNDIPTPSRYVELAQYADDTAVAATSRSPSLLVGYLEAYLGRLEHWLRDWRIAIIVSKSTAVIFVKAARRFRKPRPVEFLGELIQWVETARHLGVALDTELTWPARVDQVGKKAAQGLGVLGPSLTGEVSCPVCQKRCSALQAAHPSYDGLRMSDLEVRCSHRRSGAACVAVQVSSHCD